jgi:hypothetical protein
MSFKRCELLSFSSKFEAIQEKSKIEIKKMFESVTKGSGNGKGGEY